MWITDRLRVTTRGDDDVIDLTEKVQDVVRRHRLRDGQALVFVPGSTGGLTTMEFEPGLRHDVPEAFRRLVPREMAYRHQEIWHDDNGHSHVRASLLGPSLTVPFADGKLLLGTWQQIVLIDFDVRPRQREVVVQLAGEKD